MPKTGCSDIVGGTGLKKGARHGLVNPPKTLLIGRTFLTLLAINHSTI
jgi:hypothetical protein